MRVVSNPYDTLFSYVSSIHGELSLTYELIGISIDTSILTRFLPNSMNSFKYVISTRKLLYSGNMYLRKMTDTLNSNLSDTIVISKTINSAYDLPLKSYWQIILMPSYSPDNLWPEHILWMENARFRFQRCEYQSQCNDSIFHIGYRNFTQLVSYISIC